MRRVFRHHIGPPVVHGMFAQIAPIGGNRGHAGGAARFNVAPIVAHIPAVARIDPGGASGGQHGLGVRFGVRRGVAADHRASAREQRHLRDQWQGEALGFVGHDAPR